jgi:hypothetical protein
MGQSWWRSCQNGSDFAYSPPRSAHERRWYQPAQKKQRGLLDPAREILLYLACVLSGLGVCLAGALLASSGHAAHVISGGILFALGAAGVGLQG